MNTDRRHAEQLDAADPLAALRDEFVIDDQDLLYLDGNSLGRLPKRTAARLRDVVEREWGRDLIRSWDHWIDLPQKVGDAIGQYLVGAAPGQVLVSDSTSLNLYKLATAALAARPGRQVIVTDDDNFPTDRYVLAGVAAQHGRRLRIVHSDPVEGPDPESIAAAIDSDTALVSLSHVAYRSGALLDLASITRTAHDNGALVLWDLCHSVGALPVSLDATGVDLAVGCTYKYLNAGPGAPAFLYVAERWQDRLRQPIWGWFGQRDQFAMGAAYDPVPGIGRFGVGTPGVLGLCAVDEGVRLLAQAGLGRLRAKGVALTELLLDLAEEWLVPLGFTPASPRDPARRGAHVSLRHDDAYRIYRAYVERARVVPDFRVPDRIRFGPAPVTTRFVDVWDAMDRLRGLVQAGEHTTYDPPTGPLPS